jgi:hypothetical protein
LDKGKIIYDNEISKAVRFYTKNILKKKWALIIY